MRSSWKYSVGIGLLLGVGIIGYLIFSDSRPTTPIPDDAVKDVAYWSQKITALGGAEAYQLFSTFYDDAQIGLQHENAHIFGEALYKVEGIPGVAVCDSNYAFGCYHSFFGFALLDKGLGIIADLDQACIDVYGRKGLGCQHGIGHGVLVELGYDALTPSLEACSTLDWKEPIGGCTSGVFMEFNFHTMSEDGTRQLDERGPHYPCFDVPQKFKEACYFEQPQWWLVGDGDYIVTGERCDAAPSAVERTACYRGVGNTTAGQSGFSVTTIKQSCGMMPHDEGELLCLEGAAWLMSAEPGFEDIWEQVCDHLTGDSLRRCIASKDFI